MSRFPWQHVDAQVPPSPLTRFAARRPPQPANRRAVPPSHAAAHRLPYYWNQKTGETTAIGEPKPGPEGRLAVYRVRTRQPLPAGGGSGGGLASLLAMGAGVGLVFALLSRVV